MSLATTSLSDRILNCFPASSYGLPALLRVMQIRESETIPTATISCTGEPVMLINPRFVQRHAATPEKLFMLVMHELHHVLLGHTRSHARLTPLDNIVFDAVINAILCRRFPEREQVSFFTDFYDDREFPACFLRPGPDWDAARRSGNLPRALERARHRRRGRPWERSLRMLARLGTLHAALYSERGVSYDELREALADALAGTPPESTLVGDHALEAEGASSAGHLKERAPALFEAIEQSARGWPDCARIGGLLPHQMLEVRHVKLPPNNSARLRALFRRIANSQGRGTSRNTGEGLTTIASALPRPTRKGLVMRALGARPLLHEIEVADRRFATAGEKVHVYLDVSGSIGDLIGPLASAILSSSDAVHPVVHEFSTVVADVSLAELRRGVVRTTDGTNVECIAAHAAAHRIRRAVIVTDGFVGTPSPTGAQTLREMTLGVALVPGPTSRADLEPYASCWTRLELG